MINYFKKMFIKYTPWEMGLLNCLVASLSDSAAFVISGQVRSFNKIQRIINDSEIDFYLMRKGVVDRSGLLRLSDHSEFTLAELVTQTHGLMIVTKVQMIDGYLFSLESDFPISKISFKSDLQFGVRYLDERYGKSAQQVDSAEASTIAVPPSAPSGSPR
jgi:hypothetical protein